MAKKEESKGFRYAQYGLIGFVALIFVWMLLTAFLDQDTKARFAFIPLWEASAQNEEYQQQKEFEDVQNAISNGNANMESIYPDVWQSFDYMLSTQVDHGIEPIASALSKQMYESGNIPRVAIKYSLNSILSFRFKKVEKNIIAGNVDGNTAVMDCLVKFENNNILFYVSLMPEVIQSSMNPAGLEYTVTAKLNHFITKDPLEVTNKVTAQKGFYFPIPKKMMKKGLYPVRFHYQNDNDEGDQGDIDLLVEIVETGGDGIDTKSISTQAFFNMYAQLSHEEVIQKGFSLKGKVRYAEWKQRGKKDNPVGSCKFLVERKYAINDNPIRYLPPFPLLANGVNKEDCEKSLGKNIILERVQPYNGGDVWGKSTGRIVVEDKLLESEMSDDYE